MALFFLFAISLAGSIALWPENKSHARAEGLASPLARELAALSAVPGALQARLLDDPLIATVAVWAGDGRILRLAAPQPSVYDLTPDRLRALEALLANPIMPVWAPAPFTNDAAIVRCQRLPDICIVFATQPLAQYLEFHPTRLMRPLQGPYALGPALLLCVLALCSATMLLWRQLRRRKG